MENLIKTALQLGAQGLLLEKQKPPIVELDGKFKAINQPPLTEAAILSIIEAIAPQQRDELKKGKPVSGKLQIKGLGEAIQYIAQTKDDNPIVRFVLPQKKTPQKSIQPEKTQDQPTNLNVEHPGLIICQDQQILNLLKQLFQKLSTTPVPINKAEELRSVLRAKKPQIIALHQSHPAYIECLKTLYELTIQERLHMFIILIGDELLTGNPELEFSLSADMIINTQDLPKLEQLYQLKSLEQNKYQKVYKLAKQQAE